MSNRRTTRVHFTRAGEGGVRVININFNGRILCVEGENNSCKKCIIITSVWYWCYILVFTRKSLGVLVYGKLVKFRNKKNLGLKDNTSMSRL